MNSSSIVLYFIKEVDGFEEKGEGDEARQEKDQCQHSVSVLRTWAKRGALMLFWRYAIGFQGYNAGPARAYGSATLPKWKGLFQNGNGWGYDDSHFPV